MASEEDVLLREVDEDLQQDQLFSALQKYRALLIGAAVTVVSGVTAYQVIDNNRDNARTEAAEAYADVSFAAVVDPTPQELIAFAEAQPNGYGVLASLRAAAELGALGDLEGARDLYKGVIADETASPAMRDLARIRAAHLLLDREPDEASSLVALVETTAFRPHSEEVISAAALLTNQFKAARAGFNALAQSPDTPAGMKARAEALATIADAADYGAAIAKPVSQADTRSFIERFGADLEAAGAPVSTGTAAPMQGLQELLDQAQGAAAAPEPAPAETDDTPEAPQ